MCGCNPGFKLANNSVDCININECEGNQEVCTHDCFDTKGSFVCKCKRGYQLRPDGYTCTSGGKNDSIKRNFHLMNI